MRKILLVVCSLMMCFLLCSCGKSEAAQNVDDIISEIGPINLYSEDSIGRAERAVAELEEEDYKQLEKLEILAEARETFTNLQVDEVEGWINKIETAKEPDDKKKAVKAARYHYNKADDKIKAMVTNYSELEDAELELGALDVEKVIQLIDGIGDVDMSKESAVKEAMNAYTGLSPKEREKVTNYNILSDAADKIQGMKDKAAAQQKADAEKRLKQALSKMRVEKDKVENITWYYPSVLPKYIDVRSYVLPYIGQRNDEVWLCLRLNYTGDDWLFFDRVTFAIDGKNYYKTYGHYDIHRDNDTEVWENIDFNPTSEDVKMLKEIANSKETIVRFQGEQYYYDLTVKSSDKEAIKDVLAVYDSLNKQ